MSYKSWHLLPLDTTSAAFLQIFPEYTYKEQQTENIKQNYTLGGELNTYRIEGYKFNYSLPLTNVSSEQVSKITEWWEDRKTLALAWNFNEAVVSTIKVKIINNNNPFSTKTNRSWNNYDGFLRLQSTEGIDKSIYSGLSFILDDPIAGKLDQAYNPLI